VAAGAAAAAGAGSAQAASPVPDITSVNFPVYLPVVQMMASEVVRVHDADVTSWNFSTGWYGDYVDQTGVNNMLVRGVKEVTHQASAGGAWAELLPGYAPGKKIAVKVNLNNSRSTVDTDNIIDALPQLVIALLTTLNSDFGVLPADVMVYDARRCMPSRFYDPILATFPQADLYDTDGVDPIKIATFNHIDPSLRVTFLQPNLVGERWLTDLLFQASYVINIPIIKKHTLQPATLGYKNHFGSMSILGSFTGVPLDDLHPYITPTNAYYDPAKIPLVDINANPNIRNKTVLTIGDALYGAPSVSAVPIKWTTFGTQAPNSLLFSRDRVAVDCVMTDLLRAEFGFDNPVYPPVFSGDVAYDYLKNAEVRGLGRFEKGEPWGAGYSAIRYRVVEM
jgi:hypothetical protein